MIEKFSVSFHKGDIDKLKLKLDLTEFPDELTNTKTHYRLNYHKGLIEKWKKFNFKNFESKLNDFDNFYFHFNNNIKVHFILKKSSTKDSKVLLLIHGWPGSYLEYGKVINPLNELGYTVVVPSLIGFGFSSIPTERGYNIEKNAIILNSLMLELGFKEYYAQAGDWGSYVVRTLGHRYPENCTAVHINFLMPNNLNKIIRNNKSKKHLLSNLSDLDKIGLSKLDNFAKKGRAYFKIQAEKPERLSFALSDSPSGLIGWIGDTTMGASRFRVTEDDLIENATLYWLTRTIASSIRLYSEERYVQYPEPGFVKVPSGITIFPDEMAYIPLSWAKEYLNVVSYSYAKKGGHFPQLEYPEIYIAEIHNFFSKFGGKPASKI
ncbi:hypothetical protein HK099_005779 [Clydaea vesicula]|uniref:Epoxide hydrolase N-terminal domain-containing protein n=1 Tax=Clydaea vesicula TaxID=447962 RepID=A0AAD5U144_9FUNG|nr:hypothetical protein HK099_005779 [Clydaea vesicula]